VWQLVTQISSGLALSGFIVAAGVTVYRYGISRSERLIKAARATERAKLVERALEFHNIDTSLLTRKQQYELAIEQTRARARRFNIAAVVITAISCLVAGVAMYAIRQDAPRGGLLAMPSTRDERGGSVSSADNRVGQKNTPSASSGGTPFARPAASSSNLKKSVHKVPSHYENCLTVGSDNYCTRCELLKSDVDILFGESVGWRDSCYGFKPNSHVSISVNGEFTNPTGVWGFINWWIEVQGSPEKAFKYLNHPVNPAPAVNTLQAVADRKGNVDVHIFTTGCHFGPGNFQTCHLRPLESDRAIVIVTSG